MFNYDLEQTSYILNMHEMVQANLCFIVGHRRVGQGLHTLNFARLQIIQIATQKNMKLINIEKYSNLNFKKNETSEDQFQDCCKNWVCNMA
jgi:hypothetical protein